MFNVHYYDEEEELYKIVYQVISMYKLKNDSWRLYTKNEGTVYVRNITAVEQ